jgi:hypothetical protein
MSLEGRQKFREIVVRSAQQGHPASEPSTYPPAVVQGRPGDGNPHLVQPPQRSVEATEKAARGVWGIIAIMFGCAAAGWTVHSFIAKPLIAETVKDELKPIRDDVAEMKKTMEANQKAVEITLTEHAKDIEFLGRDQQRFETQPLPAKKKKAP